MRIGRALLWGTIISLIVTGIFVLGNGTPVPPGWQGKLAYPTGNAVQYFIIIWAIYALSLWFTREKDTVDAGEENVGRPAAAGNRHPRRGNPRGNPARIARGVPPRTVTSGRRRTSSRPPR